jgi:tetratricopeptide (TPR) repeat protein
MNIFISYRRSDTPDVSGRIYDELARHFGADAVFKDVDDIPFGVNFSQYLNDTIQQSSVMLIVIGRNWLDVTDERGRRRLDQPEDFVRVEVKAALERGIPIVPLLVQGASMPQQGELPADLAPLSLYNGTQIRPDPDFHTDMGRLIRQLEPHVDLARAVPAESGATPQSARAATRERAPVGQADQSRLAALYTDARSAYYTNQWQTAIDLLGRIVSLQADYERAAQMLEEAKRQHTLSKQYALGDAAYDAGQWPEAIERLEAVVALDAGYEDAATKLQQATRQKQLADLYEDARQLHRAERWPAVVEVFERIYEIQPGYADPDDLLSSARSAAKAKERKKRLAALYDQGLAHIDAQEWPQAAQAFEQIAQNEPGYRETQALLARTRQETAAGKPSHEPAESADSAPQIQVAEETAQEQARAVGSVGRTAKWDERSVQPTSRPWVPWVLVGIWLCLNVSVLIAIVDAGQGLARWIILVAAGAGFALWGLLRRRARGPARAVLAVAGVWAVLLVWSVVIDLF